MRTIVLSGLLLAFFSLNLIAVPAPTDSKPAEPTKEQLVAAKEAYAKLGAEYYCDIYPTTNSHVFGMPNKTTDADLKGLPDLPFRFGLNLTHTKVTDAGLKALANLKNLTYLLLERSEVTDAGIKELQEALPKCQIYLAE